MINSASRYFSKLGLFLPHPVDSKNGKAQWDKTKGLLTVTVRLTREYDFLTQWYKGLKDNAVDRIHCKISLECGLGKKMDKESFVYKLGNYEQKFLTGASYFPIVLLNYNCDTSTKCCALSQNCWINLCVHNMPLCRTDGRPPQQKTDTYHWSIWGTK